MSTRKIRGVQIGSGQKRNICHLPLLLLKRTVPLLALLFIFFSCNDLQTADKEVIMEPSIKVNQGSGALLSEVDLLPEPNMATIAIGATAAKSKATAKGPKRYKRVKVHPKWEKPGSKGAPVVATLADAVERVESGGTITVFSGEYELAEEVIIDRPVTIEPGKGASPVIKNIGQYAFVVTGVQAGPVVFNDLTFINTAGSSSLMAQGSDVRVSGSSFDAGNGTAGAYAGTGATLNIENSTFTNGLVGAYSSGDGTELNISSSTFSGHSLVGVQHQSQAAGTVKDNTMSSCGTNGCVRMITSGKVDLLDNTFSDDTPSSEVDGFFHHVVLYSQSEGLVSGNLFDGCGHGQCIAGIDGSTLEVSDNEFNIYEEHETRFVIVGSDGTGGQDPYGREVDLLVTNNLISGTGGRYESDPNNPDAYAIKLGGLLIENLGRMEAYGNTIENANMGISVLSGGILVHGSDNDIKHVRTAIAAYDLAGLGDSFARLRSNDFSGYTVSVLNDAFSPGSDMSCNWWGTAVGPQNAEGGRSSVSLYTPWASSPVAGTGTCSENSLTTISS